MEGDRLCCQQRLEQDLCLICTTQYSFVNQPSLFSYRDPKLSRSFDWRYVISQVICFTSLDWRLINKLWAGCSFFQHFVFLMRPFLPDYEFSFLLSETLVSIKCPPCIKLKLFKNFG